MKKYTVTIELETAQDPKEISTNLINAINFSANCDTLNFNKEDLKVVESGKDSLAIKLRAEQSSLFAKHDTIEEIVEAYNLKGTEVIMLYIAANTTCEILAKLAEEGTL